MKTISKILTYIIVVCFIIGGVILFRYTHAPLLKQTQIITLKPWQNNKLANQYKISRTLTGECFAGSIATARPDAWRCMVGNEILDPCFSQPKPPHQQQPQTLACLKSPLQHEVTLLTAKLDMSKANITKDSTKTLPWAVKLANSSICTLLTGATAPINNQRINYGCDNGEYLVGNFNKNNPVWTVSSVNPKQVAKAIEALGSNTKHYVNFIQIEVAAVWK